MVGGLADLQARLEQSLPGMSNPWAAGQGISSFCPPRALGSETRDDNLTRNR